MTPERRAEIEAAGYRIFDDPDEMFEQWEADGQVGSMLVKHYPELEGLDDVPAGTFRELIARLPEPERSELEEVYRRSLETYQGIKDRRAKASQRDVDNPPTRPVDPSDTQARQSE
jgi:hypothetical protein